MATGKSCVRSITGTLAVLALGSLAVPAASAAESHDDARHATVEFEQNAQTNNDRIQPRGAGGGTWAPGGVGSRVTIGVGGSGLDLGQVHVSYYPSMKWDVDNVCNVGFELSYYDSRGHRRTKYLVQRQCHPIAAPWDQTFNMQGVMTKDGSKTCGRVYVSQSGEWSPYACVTMHR